MTDALTKKNVLKWLEFIDISWKDGGLLNVDTFLNNLMEQVKVTEFEELQIPLSVVAADELRRALEKKLKDDQNLDTHNS